MTTSIKAKLNEFGQQTYSDPVMNMDLIIEILWYYTLLNCHKNQHFFKSFIIIATSHLFFPKYWPHTMVLKSSLEFFGYLKSFFKFQKILFRLLCKICGHLGAVKILCYISFTRF